jgi:hypothetical protein
MAENPSPVVGFRLAVRLHKLALASWLVMLAVFVPAQAVVGFATAPVRANLPDAPLAQGDEVLILVETLRPVVWPLALAVLSGWLALAVWSVLWHAGTVRWWLSAGAVRVRLAEIVGHGVVWWWRYARLTVTAVAVAAAGLTAVWLPVVRLVTGGADHIGWLLVAGLAVSAVVLLVSWPATLRGAWLLGESGRRSAVVAWLRGLGATLQHPLRSLLPLLVWALPGAALLALPLLADGAAAIPTLLAAPLLSSFCAVALYLSYAPQEPPEEWIRKMQARAAARAAKPRPPEDHYKTGRIPTQPPHSN